MICNNCTHNCVLSDGQTGLCHARSMRGGKVVCDNYGAVTSLALDPVEKKPLAMFYPGRMILSAGSYGCNMHCMWCQNDSISRGYVDTDHLTPGELVEIAREERSRNNIGIAYTYNEPSVGYEFVYDCARLARQNHLVNVMVTNGMLSRDRFDKLAGYIDAYNIDLKTGDGAKYESIGGDLSLVVDNIRSAHRAGAHVELTSLIVPGFNDDEADFSRIIGIISDIDPDIPLHITRFFPAGSMRHAAPTKRETLYSFRDMAKCSLSNVFLGNI